jgi:transcriptional regulator of arginine metabolism
MKKDRLQKILEIIDIYRIETQDELIARLHDCGYEVTQATVSRDIKRLHLIKIQTDDGHSKYSLPRVNKFDTNEKYRNILHQTISAVHCANNLVVVRTYSGMANAAGAAIDAMQSELLLGSIAGDDTIFIVAVSNQAASQFVAILKSIAEI